MIENSVFPVHLNKRIYKKDSTNIKESYMPVSILPKLSKIFWALLVYTDEEVIWPYSF